MLNIIIDIEFTGLDNTFINDNEIVQLKMLNTATGTSVIKNFRSVKAIGAHTQCFLKTERYQTGTFFTNLQFLEMVAEINPHNYTDINYYGFGTSSDVAMLKKYGITIAITDIRTILQTSQHEIRMATEGSNLESTYLIVTGKYPRHSDHSGIDELYTIYELFEHAITCKCNPYYTVMPHGHCAGMPLRTYCQLYRRQADGYRFNNNDLLAETMNFILDEITWDPDNEPEWS